MSFELLFFALFAGGWLAGRLFDLLRLPAVLGMTLWGIALAAIVPAFNPGAASAVLWPAGFWEVVPFIKSLALVIILLRAGLGISRSDLKSAGLPALLMGFVPCLCEAAALTGLMMWLFGFAWDTALLTGLMLSAVSPAVVIPSMLDLKGRGLGQRNGVITVVLAGSSVDNVLAITLFSLVLGIAGAGNPVASSATAAVGTAGSAALSFALVPLTLIAGLALGLVAGFALAWWFKKRQAQIRATEKALLLLASGMFLVQVGHWLQVAALLGVMAMGLVLLERAEPVARELAGKLGKIWIFAQIALFVIIGLSIDIPTALDAGPKALLGISLGLVARSLGVLLATLPSRMNLRERLFCVIAYLPKATVQAALGGVALGLGLPGGKTILAIALVSILFTAPLGLIGIRATSKKLLE